MTRQRVAEAEAEKIREYLARVPEYGRTTATREVVRAVMLKGDRMMSRGRNWAVKSKAVGGGISAIWLEPSNP